MELSRRRERELAHLGEEAHALWRRQRDVLGRAGDLLRETGRQAGDIGREDIYPKAKASLEPALRRVGRFAAKPERSTSFGSVILMALGAIAAAVIGYAVWSTLRSDDDLWVDADDDH